MTKMSRKNKKTLKRKHRKTTKKGTKSIRKMKGGWPFGFSNNCFDNENTINAAVTTNTTDEQRKTAIINYIRNKCAKENSIFIIYGNNTYYVKNGICVNVDTNDNEVYVMDNNNNKLILLTGEDFNNIKVPRIDSYNSEICIINNNKKVELKNCLEIT